MSITDDEEALSRLLTHVGQEDVAIRTVQRRVVTEFWEWFPVIADVGPSFGAI